tara:strand:- start:4231 stop:4419 length:189 start_codon:yes stop_codon:yes gene_type:complete
MAKTYKRRQKRSRSRSRRGGHSGMLAALKTALLPFSLFKIQKSMQKRKRKSRKRRRTRRKRK